MGFEIKLYIVAETEHNFNNISLQVGSFDLCKPGYDTEIYKLHHNGTCDSVPRGLYIGDNSILEDSYGEELWSHPIKDVIKALEGDNRNEKYWRFQTALDMLRSIERNWSWFGKPFVITFGH